MQTQLTTGRPTPPVPGGRRRDRGDHLTSRRETVRDRLTPLWLLSPAMIVIGTLTIVPVLLLVASSFTDYDQRSLFTGAFDLVGLRQYLEVFSDAEFWWATILTVAFTVAMVAATIIVGMAVAQLLTRCSRPVRHVVTVVLVLAWAMPNVASSVVWTWLFQPGYGVVNWLLEQLVVFGDTSYLDWRQSPVLAFLSVWLLVVWQAVPFVALTLYAAQTQIPAELLEAARLDGAGEWRMYRSIVLRILRPTLLLLVVLSTIWDFNVFNQIWLVTQGGPDGATTTLGVYTYRTAFVSFGIGKGAAISTVTTVLLLILTMIYVRRLVRSGEEL
ncbi:carbohydrate ABC transporter permease [Plantactinospora sp. WMMB782]|uniref:carbohydrate ABC transporter permease n=1 Tax=Plantactinospora sp. WMMB782 TaxID=3404121 RepID=UPI003B9610C6